MDSSPRSLMKFGIESDILLSDPEFWYDYFELEPESTRDYRLPTFLSVEIEHVAFKFVFSDPLHQVHLNLDLGNDEIELGWDDHAHWHPHVFRLQEIVGLSSNLAISMTPHSSEMLFLLFSKFVICDSDADREYLINRIAKDSENLGVPNRISIGLRERIAQQSELDIRWIRDSGFWIVTGDDHYSLRTNEKGQFPHDLFSRLFAATNAR